MHALHPVSAKFLLRSLGELSAKSCFINAATLHRWRCKYIVQPRLLGLERLSLHRDYAPGEISVSDLFNDPDHSEIAVPADINAHVKLIQRVVNVGLPTLIVLV